LFSLSTNAFEVPEDQVGSSIFRETGKYKFVLLLVGSDPDREITFFRFAGNVSSAV
jgi:hypothetical protein